MLRMTTFGFKNAPVPAARSSFTSQCRAVAEAKSSLTRNKTSAGQERGSTLINSSPAVTITRMEWGVMYKSSLASHTTAASNCIPMDSRMNRTLTDSSAWKIVSFHSMLVLLSARVHYLMSNAFSKSDHHPKSNEIIRADYCSIGRKSKTSRWVVIGKGGNDSGTSGPSETGSYPELKELGSEYCDANTCGLCEGMYSIRV